MAKGNSRSSKSNGGKSNTQRNTSNRPRPMAPKAGVTKHRSRYENGGDFCY